MAAARCGGGAAVAVRDRCRSGPTSCVAAAAAAVQLVTAVLALQRGIHAHVKCTHSREGRLSHAAAHRRGPAASAVEHQPRADQKLRRSGACAPPAAASTCTAVHSERAELAATITAPSFRRPAVRADRPAPVRARTYGVGCIGGTTAGSACGEGCELYRWCQCTRGSRRFGGAAPPSVRGGTRVVRRLLRGGVVGGRLRASGGADGDGCSVYTSHECTRGR